MALLFCSRRKRFRVFFKRTSSLEPVGKSMGGTDDPSNLRAICSVCNEGARNLTLDRLSARKLLIQVRRATIADQLAVLKWLNQKFAKKT